MKKRGKSAKKEKKSKGSVGTKIKGVILAIAIVIVLTSFIQVGINTFHERPDYEDFCDKRAEPIPVERTAEGIEKLEYNETYYKECQNNYDEAREGYSGIVFWISLIIGLVILIVGIMLKMTSIASGVMGAGVITIFIGITQNWRYFEEYMKFIILGLILAILIWLGYKKLNK